jgi:hypothetical protein
MVIKVQPNFDLIAKFLIFSPKYNLHCVHSITATTKIHNSKEIPKHQNLPILKEVAELTETISLDSTLFKLPEYFLNPLFQCL